MPHDLNPGTATAPPKPFKPTATNPPPAHPRVGGFVKTPDGKLLYTPPGQSTPKGTTRLTPQQVKQQGLGQMTGWLATTGTNLASELAGVGPGLVSTAVAAYHHPLATAEQVGKTTYHSLGQTIHHPGRQLENDPLGLITNVALPFAAAGSVAGRAAAIGDEGSLAGKAAAAIRAPRPVERTLVTARDEAGNATQAVHPLGSANYSAGMLQKHVVDPIHQFVLDHPQSRAAQILNSRVAGAQVKVGREIRAAERVRTAAATAPATQVARVGKKLSAPEAKAVQIVASGVHPDVWASLERHALEQGIGETGAHRLQLGLTQRAAKLVDTPRVQAAADAMRGAIGAREQIRGMSEDEILHRLGAHALAIEHGATGFVGKNPVERLHDLQAMLEEPPGVDVQGKINQLEGLLKARHVEGRAAAVAKYSGVEQKLARLRAQPPGMGEYERAGWMQDVADQANALHDEIRAAGERVKAKGGFYLPMQRESKPLAPLRGLVGGRRSKYGMSAAVREERNYPYEGGMLKRGDYRTDVAALTNRAFRQAQSIDQAKRIHAAVYDMAKPTKEEAGGERFAEAVRPKQVVSESLKRSANALEPLKVERGDQTLHDLVNSWYDEMRAHPGEDVRYIDKRLLAPLRPYEPKLGAVGERIDQGNQLVRIGRYMLPRYLQWLPQNVAFTLPRQRFWMVRNAARWKTEFPKLAPEVRDRIFAVMGHGASRALEGDTHFLGGTQERLAEFWNRVNDIGPRVMAWIHEAESAGFKGAAGYTRLVTDPALESKFIEVTRRANKEAGDYAISNVERATLKKLVPSWAWDKAASQWVGRLLIEHPYLARLLAYSGHTGQNEIDKFFAHLHGLVPSWLQGVLPLGPHSGLETSGLLPTDTPAKLLEIASGQLAPVHEFAPIPAAGLELATGLNPSGGKISRLQALEQLATKRFGPGREIATAVGKPGGVFASGPKAAILDALGYPVEDVEMAKAAASGLRSQGTQSQKDTFARQKALETAGAMIHHLNVPDDWRKTYMVATSATVDRDQAKAAARRALPSGQRLPARQGYAITMRVLRDDGMMTAQQYQSAISAAPKMTDKQLAYWERRAWDELGPGAVLRDFHRYYRTAYNAKKGT
jgi:hypothetical protein